MLGSLSITHWIVVIAVITLLFGRGRISGLMEDVGKGLRSLRHINDDGAEASESVRAEAEELRRLK